MLLLGAIALCATQLSCSAVSGSESGEAEPGVLTIVGTVRFVSIEGGFFGVVGDDGARWDPTNLPEAYRQDGRRLRMRARRIPGSVGFHMWGTSIEVLSAERID